MLCGSPNGIRTRVDALKGRYPGPLDDGAVVGGNWALNSRHKE